MDAFGTGVCDCHAHLACCCQYLFGTQSSNTVGTFYDSPALLFDSLVTCGAQCAGTKSSENQLDRTHAVSTGSVLLLLSHNFDQPTARSLPFSLCTCIVSRCRIPHAAVLCPLCIHCQHQRQAATMSPC